MYISIQGILFYKTIIFNKSRKFSFEYFCCNLFPFKNIVLYAQSFLENQFVM
nr:MAG TPA: hypothetical protein [Caudoviricetes sp.]